MQNENSCEKSNEIIQLKHKIKALEQQYERKKREENRFVQNVAHQLTAPLGAIRWEIESLMDIVDGRLPIIIGKECFDSISFQVDKYYYLVRNFELVLQLNNDSNLTRYVCDGDIRIDIVEKLKELTVSFHPRGLDELKTFHIDEASFRNVLGPKMLHVIRELYQSALLSVLDNAIKYSDAGSVIKISAKEEDGIGIEFCSEGIPINPEEIKEVVKFGYRAQAARNKDVVGLGMGLYLTGRIMALHDGKLLIKTAGRTTRVILIFPVSRIV